MGIALHQIAEWDERMLKISIVEAQGQRRLVLEGTLVRPWTVEVERAWYGAQQELQGRKLVIDLSNVTLTSIDGEETLSRLMSEGAKFSCGGVFMKHVLKQVARKVGCTS
jgi:hypothetical protein